MSNRHDTIVIGAGISGLAYAHALGPDADVLVLEAGDAPGGLVRTTRVDDVTYECGPEALQDNAPETRAMCAELGLPLVQADDAAHARFVLAEAPAGMGRHGHTSRVAAFADAADASEAAERGEAPPTVLGRLVPVPTGPGEFLKTPLLTRRGRARALLEPFRARGPGLDGSVADFIRHRLGAEVLTWLVDPFVTGVYAGDPELLSVRSAFPLLHEMVSGHGSLMKGLKARAKARRAAGEPRAGAPSLMAPKGGLGAMPAAIAAGLGDRLRLSCPVERLARKGDDWLVEGPGGAWRAGRVVLALPASAAAAITAQDLPELSQPLGATHGESVVSVSHLWRREDVAHPLNGFGYLVPSALKLRHLGTLFSSTIQPDRCPPGQVLLRTLMGGAHHPELADGDADFCRQIVAHEVGATLGLSGEPLWSSVTTWRGVLPRYDLDHPARQDRIDALLGQLPGLSILGNHRRGISVNALIESARQLARDHAAALHA